MEPGVGAEHAKFQPPDIKLRAALKPESPYVAGPEGNSAEGQVQTAFNGACKASKIRSRITAPVNRIFLGAGPGASGPYEGLIFPKFLLSGLVCGLIVQQGIQVMHVPAVGTCILKKCRGGFPKVNLDDIHALPEQGFYQFFLIPVNCLRIGEVNKSVRKLKVTVRISGKISVGSRLVINLIGGLSPFNIGKLPERQLISVLVEFFNHLLYLWEFFLVKLPVTHPVFRKPVRINMYDVTWKPAASHLSGHPLHFFPGAVTDFTHPDAEGPFGRHRRQSCQPVIRRNNVLYRVPCHQKII